MNNDQKISDRINARLPEELAQHVSTMIGKQFETPSEYIRHLIREDIRNTQKQDIEASIREGLHDHDNRRTVMSSGSWDADKQLLDNI